MVLYLDISVIRDGPPEFKFRDMRVIYEVNNEIFYGTHPRQFAKGDNPPIEELEGKTKIELTAFPVHEPKLYGTAYTMPPENCYVRRPNLMNFNRYKQECSLVESFSREANAYAKISQSKHPNLVYSLGSLVRDGYVIGFILPKYRTTLIQAIEDDYNFDTDTVMRDITNAVLHRHSLGLCHNDIHMQNIMFDFNGNVVLIDVEFACEEGTVLDYTLKTSEKENDLSRLKTVREDITVLRRKVAKGESLWRKATIDANGLIRAAYAERQRRLQTNKNDNPMVQ